jgi:hypothetical protein
MRDIRKELTEVAELAERTKDQRLGRFGRPPKPQGEVGQVYSIRIPVTQITELEELAAHGHKAPRTMLREWVLERLENEINEARLGGAKTSRPAKKSRKAETQRTLPRRVSRRRAV